MGSNPASQPAETLVQLVLRARQEVLVQTTEDWRSLALIAARMLFWYGGAIYACRCEGREMRFALQVVHAALGAIAHQIAGAYATHLRKTRGLSGSLFKHYIVVPLSDEIFLDDLVFWLHRSPSSVSPQPMPKLGSNTQVWTADGAYLVPNSMPWINSDRVLNSLSVGAPGPATYRRRKLEPISPQVLEFFTRRPKDARAKQFVNHAKRAPRARIETIARTVAEYCKVPFEEMLKGTRKRSVSRARAIAAVLATRNGATAASAARLFHRSRSTLIEQVEHYRATQPGIFAEAEDRLEALLSDPRE
jgi:hypothetical protein